MTYQHYTAEFKAKIVLEILQGERELGEVAKEYSINPRLTVEHRRVLERVFDLIMQEYDKKVAENFVNTISLKF